MRAMFVIFLLAFPGVTFLVYVRMLDQASPEWKYFWLNYAWCAAGLFVSVIVLAALRVRFSTWLIALVAGNVALIAFCLWMAYVISRGYRDTEIAWIFPFPFQIVAMAVACSARGLFGKLRRLREGGNAA